MTYEALQLMRTAADRENSTEKATVTLGPIIPARELLGEMFLAVDEPHYALQAFEDSMQAEPNRFWGLYGAARAAELAGDRQKARTYACLPPGSPNQAGHRSGGRSSADRGRRLAMSWGWRNTPVENCGRPYASAYR
jgi:hypothetical protein